jgi:hypothetical protein
VTVIDTILKPNNVVEVRKTAALPAQFLPTKTLASGCIDDSLWRNNDVSRNYF